MRGVSCFVLVLSFSMVLGRSVDVSTGSVEKMERMGCGIDGNEDCRRVLPPTSTTTVDDVEDNDFVWIDNISPLEDTPAITITASSSATSHLGGANPEPTTKPDIQDNLTSQYPPSNPSRRWGWAIGFFALFTLISITYIYRSSLPLPTSSLKYTLALPSLASLKYNLLPSSSSPRRRIQTHKKSKSKSSFRPSPSSLLRWAREDRPNTDFFVGDLEDGGVDGDYEQVGLLPSPSPYRSNFAASDQRGNGELREQRSYGSISGRD